MLFVEHNISFNENETELEIKNPTHSFRDNELVLQLI